MTIRDMIPWVVEAEKRGLEMAFFSETIKTLRDAVSALSCFALSTSRIKLGCTQILRIRSPLVIAQTFATLDEIAAGRIILSLGACTRSHQKKHGLEELYPPAVLKEHTELIRRYLEGRPVEFSGSTIKVNDNGLGFSPIRQRIPIWIAATSKIGLEIAGAIGDGVLLNATTSSEYCRNAVQIVRESAARVGRDPHEVMVAGLIVAAVSDDIDKAMDAVRPELASKFGPMQASFAVQTRAKVGEPFVSETVLARLAGAFQDGGAVGLMEELSPSLIKGLTAVGDRNEVRARIQEYRDAGIALPIVRPASSDVFRAVFETIAPVPACV